MTEVASSIPSHLTGLNPRQTEAVLHFRGPILVLAGAGSGKTRVLTRRVAHLVLSHHVPPQAILAVTFTNKATEEMRERLHDLLGERAKGLWAATFHSTALRMLRRHAAELGYSSDFVIYDDQDTKSVLKQILKDCNIDEKKYPLQSFSRAIDAAKNALIQPEDYLRWAKENNPSANRNSAFDVALNQNAEVYQYYQRALRRANAMDFGDLVMNAVLLLQGFPEVRQWYQTHLQFVLVDEFQDTNIAQYELIRLLTEKHRNLLVVGDDDQSIYAFRGASIRNILEFEKDFPDTKVVTLDQNYRSTGIILDAAHQVIKHNTARKPKKLWTDAAPGDDIQVYIGADEVEEAKFIAAEISKLRSEKVSLRDIALFYRTNAQSRAIEEALLEAQIPYRIYGGLKFYERKEIKDLLAYLRLLVNETDDQAVLRTINTPPRGIGAQTVQSLIKRAQQDKVSLFAAARQAGESNKNIKKYIELVDEFRGRSATAMLSVLIHDLVQSSGYGPKLVEMNDVTAQSRIENLLELEAIGRSLEVSGLSPRETLQAFLDRVSLTAGSDNPSESMAKAQGEAVTNEDESVCLMTLHLAKGLEFPYVFLTGLEEGLLPHYRSLYDPVALEEERRLCYVGVTRAMQRLYLTRSISRGMFSSGDGFGGGMYRDKSRFLSDIPEGLLAYRTFANLHFEEFDDLL